MSEFAKYGGSSTKKELCLCCGKNWERFRLGSFDYQYKDCPSCSPNPIAEAMKIESSIKNPDRQQTEGKPMRQCIRHYPEKWNGCEACDAFWTDVESILDIQSQLQSSKEFWISAKPNNLIYSEVFVTNKNPKCLSEDDDYFDLKSRPYFHVIEHSAYRSVLDQLSEANETIEKLREQILGAKLAFYMMPTANLFGKTTRMIADMITQMRPNSEIKVTCPDVEKLESELQSLKAENELLIKELKWAEAELRGHAVWWDEEANQFRGNEAFKAANNINEALAKCAKGEKV